MAQDKGRVNLEELEWLAELLNKYPRESLKRIADIEGIEYHRLKRLYDRYYGRYVFVNAMYNITKLGLKSYVAFLSVPKVELRMKAEEMLRNPFVVHVTPIFGFKNGLNAILHIPVDQEKYIPELLSKYSNDFEYYEVWAYPMEKGKEVKFGRWRYSYEYALLLDILKIDARTPMKELERRLGRSRPTIKFMIKRLIEDGIIQGFYAYIDNVQDVYDRSFVGIAEELPEDFFQRFGDMEIQIGVLSPRGYFVEWYFSSKEDMGGKILEFGQYVEKMAIGYLDMFRELNHRHMSTRYSRMVKEDGSGYRSILEF
ncbi:Lrp/AsnC family transcriptional regulator [Pyrococcus yayanosii]|uniref:Putative HTH transcription regulator n=1 Tax=Pyrococcus yayanosii (strain CH1 / JCM 16557) TaxID=529709 RepID=F8AFN0_PYRYC|nr:Lrp/AsnC family transcriptional regulator [Pyrococcus yayanosii]AEH24996.1 putative HTH transcription regulator [Pyrococcus yayanosii CH1]